MAGGFVFSDDLGGFRLLSVSGSGVAEDPIVIVEEIIEAEPVVLRVNRVGGRPSPGLSGGLGFLNLAVIKIVINASRRVWGGFDLELQQELSKPSGYGDGLSFDQLNTTREPFDSDRFALHRQLFEPYDRVRFQDGYVDPGDTVRFSFRITDPTPTAEFFLVQDPQLLMARRVVPGPSLAAR